MACKASRGARDEKDAEGQARGPGAGAGAGADADEEGFPATNCRVPVTAYEGFLQEHGLADTKGSSLVYQIHRDLGKLRKWKELRIHCSKKAGVYLSGCAPKGFDAVFGDKGGRQIVLAVCKWEQMAIRKWASLVKECRREEEGNEVGVVTVGFVDQDGSVCYYRVFAELEGVVDEKWKRKKERGREGEGEGEGEVESEEDVDSEA